MRNGVPLVVSRRRKLEESISDAGCSWLSTLAHFRGAPRFADIRCGRLLYCLISKLCGEWDDRMNICSALTLVVTGRRCEGAG